MRFLLILPLLALGACNTGPLATLTPGEVVERVQLADGTVVIAGPEAYCIDGEGSRPRAGLILLAPCGASGGTEFPRRSAILTAQIGGPASASVAGSEPVLAAFVGSPAGAAAVGLSGTTLGDIRTGSNLVTMRIIRGEADALTGTDVTEWRAFTDVGDRLVTLTVRSIAGEPLTATQGDRLLNRFVGAVRSASTQ